MNEYTSVTLALFDDESEAEEVVLGVQFVGLDGELHGVENDISAPAGELLDEMIAVAGELWGRAWTSASWLVVEPLTTYQMIMACNPTPAMLNIVDMFRVELEDELIQLERILRAELDGDGFWVHGDSEQKITQAEKTVFDAAARLIGEDCDEN